MNNSRHMRCVWRLIFPITAWVALWLTVTSQGVANIAGGGTGAGSTLTFTDAMASAASAFYRVVVTSP